LDEYTIVARAKVPRPAASAFRSARSGADVKFL